MGDSCEAHTFHDGDSRPVRIGDATLQTKVPKIADDTVGEGRGGMELGGLRTGIEMECGDRSRPSGPTVMTTGSEHVGERPIPALSKK